MKHKYKGSTLIAVPLALIGTFILGSATCSSNKSPTPASINSAINTSVGDIVALAKAYQLAGEPGLPNQDKQLFNGLTSAVAQLQLQVGQPANPSVINTGVPATDSAVSQVVVPGNIVTQSDVNKLAIAANTTTNPPLGVPSSSNSTP